MYSNNIVNFQESTTIRNVCTKKAEILLKVPRINPKMNELVRRKFEFAYYVVAIQHVSHYAKETPHLQVYNYQLGRESFSTEHE